MKHSSHWKHKRECICSRLQLNQLCRDDISVQQSLCRRKLVVAQEAVSLELQGYESFGE